MSSPALHCSQADLFARWIPDSSRAGVILSPSPDALAPPVSPGPHDSFCSHFAPLPISADSSCVDMEPEHRGLEQEMEADGYVECSEEVQSHSLTMKLEQLRQWQQQMQQQLRAQQLQELLRLQQEQHQLLTLISPQDPEGVDKSCEAEWEDVTLHSSAHIHNTTEQEEQEGAPGHKDSDKTQTEENPQNGDMKTVQQEAGQSSVLTADRPIRAPKTFEKLLEEQLQQEEHRLKTSHQTQPAVHCVGPKRAFLRRGEGLKRFTHPKADVHKNCQTETKAVTCSSSGLSSSVHRGSTHTLQRKTTTVPQEPRPTSALHPHTKAARLKMLHKHLRQSEDLTVRSPREPPTVCESQTTESTHTQVLVQREDRERPSQERPSQERPSQERPSQERPSQERPSQERPSQERPSQERPSQQQFRGWERARQEESLELGEFELLEQAAEELSFSSNSSFVLKVLEMDRQRQLPVEDLHQRRLSSTPVKSAPNPPAFLQEPQQESTLEKPVVSVYGFPHQSEPPYDKNTYEECSLTPSDPTHSDSDSEEHTMTEHHQGQLFDDHDTWSQISPDHSLTSDSPEEHEPGSGELTSPLVEAVIKKSTVDKAVKPEDPPPSYLMSKLFPALQTHSNNAPVMAPPAAEPTNHSQQVHSMQLRERLAELEVEIQRFKQENTALTKLRQEVQREREQLRRERTQWEQTKALERSSFEEFKREETRKLQRERRMWDKHLSASRAGPNKSERHEIQALKQQLTSLTEELKRKESRWANTHSRLRHQLEALGHDNNALREEVKTLEKLRITAWKKHSTDSVVKEVKFATPLDCVSSVTAPPLNTRGSRRASAPGTSTGTRGGMKSSLRRPSLTVGGAKKTQPEDHRHIGLSPETDHSPTQDQCPTHSHSATENHSPTRGHSPTQKLIPVVPQCDPQQTEQCERQLQEPQDDASGKVEQLLSSGGRLILFPNGTKKEVSSDGSTLKVTFFNGDTKEVTADQRVIYFYCEARTTHITYPDGLEVLHFPNNQTEKHFPDGRKEITFPDQTVKNVYPSGREESVLTDGTVVQLHPDGSKEILFNTGQREVHTAEYKRREYPDGTVKTVYSDGRQETRYPTGRLRIKHPDGTVVLDTA